MNQARKTELRALAERLPAENLGIENWQANQFSFGEVRSLVRAAEAAEAKLAKAKEAIDQALDDMGEDGLSVCPACKDLLLTTLQELGD